MYNYRVARRVWITPFAKRHLHLHPIGSLLPVLYQQPSDGIANIQQHSPPDNYSTQIRYGKSLP